MSTVLNTLKRFLLTRSVSRRTVLIRALGVSVCLCTGVAVTTNLWIDGVSADFIYKNLEDVPVRSVAIVPGAMVYPSGKPSITLRDRLKTALELYKARKVKKILLSGDHGAKEYDEVNSMWKWMKRRGVPSRDIFLDHAGFRTLDTMVRAKNVFKVRDAVICTQEFHLARCVFLAKRAGIDAVGLIADKRIYARRRHNRVREFAAKTVSFLDSYIFDTKPRHMGTPITITGDSRKTYDSSTRL